MGDRLPSAGAVLWSQVRHHNRTFWRNPLGAFFTIGLPLLLLLALSGLTGDASLVIGERWLDPGESDEAAVSYAQVITPAIAAFAVAMAGFVQLATATAAERADGTLKRLRGTPLPPWAYLLGRVISTTWIAVIAAGLVLAAGYVVSDFRIEATGLPATVAMLLLGSLTFAALGLMLVSLASPGSVQAVAFGTLLPVAFVSEIFLHGFPLPPLLSTIGWAFPLRHLNVALREAIGVGDGSTFGWQQPLVLLAWTVLAMAVACTRFSWEPGRNGRRRRPAVAARSAAAVRA